MRKYIFDEMEFFSHFQLKKRETNFAKAGIIFLVGVLLTISIINYLWKI